MLYGPHPVVFPKGPKIWFVFGSGHQEGDETNQVGWFVLLMFLNGFLLNDGLFQCCKLPKSPKCALGGYINLFNKYLRCMFNLCTDVSHVSIQMNTSSCFLLKKSKPDNMGFPGKLHRRRTGGMEKWHTASSGFLMPPPPQHQEDVLAEMMLQLP